MYARWWLLCAYLCRAAADVPLQCGVGFFANANETGADSGRACPEDCPSLLQCGADSGRYTCVRKEMCGRLLPRGFAVHEDGTGRCASCDIPGCDKCADVAQCARCGSGFEELSGKCEWRAKMLWQAVGIAGVFLFAWACFDIAMAHLKERTNHAALKAGYISRWRAKLRNNYEMGRPQYPLCSSMHWHSSGRAPIGGPGTVLCMNWFALVAAVGIWLSVLAYHFAPQWKPKLLDPTLVWKCNLEHLQGPEPWHGTWAALNYIGATVMSAIFLMWQSLLWTSMTHDTEGDICLHFYCVEASGFPEDATDKEELAAYFSRALVDLGLPRDGVEHISIGYKFTPAEALWVEHALESHLAEEDANDPGSPSHYQENSAAYGPLSQRQVSRSVGEAEMMELKAMTADFSDTSSDAEDTDAGGFWVQLLAGVMCGTPFSCRETSVDPQSICQNEDLDELNADHFRSSGLVFVVLKMEPVAVALASAQVLPGHFRGVHDIKVKRCQSSPQTILWANFHVDSHMFWQRAVLSCFVLLVALAVWFGLYFPFYRLSMSVGSYNVTSNLAVGVSNFAGLIALGNCALSILIPKLTQYMGYWHQSEQHLTDLAVLIPCVAVNCLMDFFVTSYSSVQQLSDNLSHDVKLEVVRVPSQSEENLVYLLFPSYVLLPYLVEPVATIAFAFYIAVLRIKRDGRITPGQAEVAMMAPETDLKVPLADLICTTSTIISTLLLGPTMYHRVFFLLMIVFSGVAYIQYRIRVLRWDSACFQGTKSLHACQAAYWCFPLGLLAAAWERSWKAVPRNDLFTGWHGFTAHCMTHFIFLRFVLPGLEPSVPSSQLSYSEALSQLGGTAGLADYLNTNPIEVLKSHVVPELFTRQRLIYYRPDKEYLQRRACKFTAGDNGFMMSMLDRMHADANSVVSEMVTSVGHPLDQLAAHGADWSLASRRKAQQFMRARSGSDSETGSG
eukprot:s1977_g11.t1